ncbi:MAG: 3-deoxy-7-phosphoheptulonate synthase [SAR324 cluster bacterium]|nr:3-deoxy-7-phosphoheptulonate synthase [SAR324 cluster bacterium]
MLQTNDLNVTKTIPLVSPQELKREMPMTETAVQTVIDARSIIQNILDGKDKRLLMVVGPCSIHDPKIAQEYAGRLKILADRVADHLYVIMRVYFEKPRTIVGWKGMINDPDLNGAGDIAKGLSMARKILLEINEIGLPAGSEMLDPITPQYLAELISWAAIGARTTESQIHREMASGLSMPVGYKNGTNGNLDVALNAMQSAYQPHRFIGIDQESRTSILQTKGNPYGHVVLRGGADGPNYDADSVREAENEIAKVGLRPLIMIDCNHANSGKNPFKQEDVLQNLIGQIREKNQSIMGVMIESNLKAGNQTYRAGVPLQYGVSITDKCLDWENTERIILNAHQQLSEHFV